MKEITLQRRKKHHSLCWIWWIMEKLKAPSLHLKTRWLNMASINTVKWCMIVCCSQNVCWNDSSFAGHLTMPHPISTVGASPLVPIQMLYEKWPSLSTTAQQVCSKAENSAIYWKQSISHKSSAVVFKFGFKDPRVFQSHWMIFMWILCLCWNAIYLVLSLYLHYLHLDFSLSLCWNTICFDSESVTETSLSVFQSKIKHSLMGIFQVPVYYGAPSSWWCSSSSAAWHPPGRSLRSSETRTSRRSHSFWMSCMPRARRRWPCLLMTLSCAYNPLSPC